MVTGTRGGGRERDDSRGHGRTGDEVVETCSASLRELRRVASECEASLQLAWSRLSQEQRELRRSQDDLRTAEEAFRRDEGELRRREESLAEKEKRLSVRERELAAHEKERDRERDREREAQLRSRAAAAYTSSQQYGEVPPSRRRPGNGMVGDARERDRTRSPDGDRKRRRREEDEPESYVPSRGGSPVPADIPMPPPPPRTRGRTRPAEDGGGSPGDWAQISRVRSTTDTARRSPERRRSLVEHVSVGNVKRERPTPQVVYRTHSPPPETDDRRVYPAGRGGPRGR